MEAHCVLPEGRAEYLCHVTLYSDDRLNTNRPYQKKKLTKSYEPSNTAVSFQMLGSIG
jgi:hypothetical protein